MKAWVLGLALVPAVAFGLEVPEGNEFELLLSLIRNWHAMGPMVVGSTVVLIAIQILKKYLGDFNYKRLVVLALSALYGVMAALMQGLALGDSLILVLVTGGGAMALYEAFVNPALKLVKKNG